MTAADLPHELIDIIFAFVPSAGLHVSHKYNDVCLCSLAYSDLRDFLLHEYRKETGFCKHIWDHNYDPNEPYANTCSFRYYDTKATVSGIIYKVLMDRKFPEIVYKWFSESEKIKMRNGSPTYLYNSMLTIISYLKSIPKDSKKLVGRLTCFYSNETLYHTFMNGNLDEKIDDNNIKYFADIISDLIADTSLDTVSIVRQYLILRAIVTKSCPNDSVISSLVKTMFAQN